MGGIFTIGINLDSFENFIAFFIILYRSGRVLMSKKKIINNFIFKLLEIIRLDDTSIFGQ